jgi:MFS family permease
MDSVPAVSVSSATAPHPAAPPAGPRGLVALNALNFFLAEVAGVGIPFASDLLRERGWNLTAIGAAAAVAGLGVFLAQTPAGWLLDRLPRPRLLLAAAALVVGVGYGVLPLVPATMWAVYPALFLAGVAQAVFVSALCMLALGLAGAAGFNRVMGSNQAWNHAGNLAAALGAMFAARYFGLGGVFAGIFGMSVLAATSAALVPRPRRRESGASCATAGAGWGALARDRRVWVLVASVALFHLANAPVMPLVAVQVKDLHGTDAQVAAVVLVAQAVMIPVAYLAGRLADRWGRKAVFAVGFVALPVRIALYPLADAPSELIAIQTLDGVGAGIYGVVVAAIAADLTRGRGGFNTLNGVLATALAVGGVVGPLVAGWTADRFGFGGAYGLFAGVAVVGAVLFIGWMPETGRAGRVAGTSLVG